MSILQSTLLVAGLTVAVFVFFEFRREPDVVTVFQKVVSVKYLIPFVIVVSAFVVLRLVLMFLGPLLEFIFRP